MALTKAIAAGAAAALAIPYALEGHSGTLGAMVRANMVAVDLAGVPLRWSWTIFAVVTLFAWGLLAWANK